jgi:phosphatidate cytidylyltransferase
MNETQKRILTAVVAIPIVGYLIHQGGMYSSLLTFLLLGICIFEWTRLTKDKNTLRGFFMWIGGVLLICSAFAYLHEIIDTPLIFIILGIIWTNDTMAYFGGRLFKGPKLWPSVSPGKTWSGLVCGMIAATYIGYILMGSPLIAFYIAALGNMGDLLESKMKRYYNVKDSGSLLPGHGGMLDRLDSLLFVSFFGFIWNVYMNYR